MRRFALAAAVGSARRLLAVIIAVLAVAGAAYFFGHRLSNPDHYSRVGAFWYCGEPPPYAIISPIVRPCSPPTRAAWQIPLALAIAIGGLGAAAAVAGDRFRPRAAAPTRRAARA